MSRPRLSHPPQYERGGDQHAEAVDQHVLGGAVAGGDERLVPFVADGEGDGNRGGRYDSARGIAAREAGDERRRQAEENRELARVPALNDGEPGDAPEDFEPSEEPLVGDDVAVDELEELGGTDDRAGGAEDEG